METQATRGLTIKDAGDYLGGNTSRTTVYRLIGEGELVSYHVGVRHYVTKESLDGFINKMIHAENA